MAPNGKIGLDSGGEDWVLGLGLLLANFEGFILARATENTLFSSQVFEVEEATELLSISLMPRSVELSVKERKSLLVV